MTVTADREQLLQRRRELQQRLQRDTERASIADVLETLGASGAAYEVLWNGAEDGGRDLLRAGLSPGVRGRATPAWRNPLAGRTRAPSAQGAARHRQ